MLRAAGAEKALATAGWNWPAASRCTASGPRSGAARPPTCCCVPRPDLDAIFCGNDQIARGVADGLREAGRRVPDDVALVGFDNWEVIAVACRPPLTTVDMNLRELGRAAGERLLAAIERPAERGRPAAALQPGRARVQPSPPSSDPRVQCGGRGRWVGGIGGGADAGHGAQPGAGAERAGTSRRVNS